MAIAFEFRAKLWIYPGSAGWHFITLPKRAAKVIDASVIRIGFGAVPVVVTIGEQTWETSIFPDSSRGSYLLPVKAPIRKKTGREAGMSVRVHLELAMGRTRKRSKS